MTLNKQLINLLGILLAVVVLVAGLALIAYPMFAQAQTLDGNTRTVAQTNSVYQAQVDSLLKDGDRKAVEKAPTYRIFRTGVGELHKRGNLKGRALTEETVESIRSALDSQQIKGTGFNHGTVYSPTQPGKYVIVTVCPGFLSPEQSMTDISKRLATHGFVVAVLQTNTILDFPPSRASQILASLKAVSTLTTGPAADKIDPNRLVASGWSMGGGGTLEAAAKTPRLKAAVPFAPWDYPMPSSYKTITVPTGILGGETDTIAPNKGHSIKFYAAIPATTKKMLAIIKDAQHFFPNSVYEPASYTNIAWMKRFADDNAEYGQFLSGSDPDWSSFESTGPF